MTSTVLASVVLAAALAPGAVTLENRAMRIEFGDESEGFAVRRIVNRLAGDRAFVGDAKDVPRFWMLRFVRPEGGSNAVETVANRRRAASRTCTVANGVATFLWKGIDLPGEPGAFDVAARVVLKPDSPLSEWTIRVRNRSTRWALESTHYPCLTRVVSADDPDARVLAPTKNLGGQLRTAADWRKAPIGTAFRYPSCRLQMCSFLSGDAGLYIATHDGESRDKTLVIAPDTTFRCETVVENAGVPGKAAEGPRFAVTVGAYRGDWWQAAHLYRDWALGQKWCAKGPIATRADFPKKAADTHVWIIGGGRTNVAARTFSAMAEAWPDVGTCLTWSEWAEVSGGRASNRMNPEFFPAFEGIPALARAKVKEGFLVMPYVNGRIWDVSSCGFAYARKDACRGEDGAVRIEKYRDGWGATNAFGVMCPACPTWRKVVTDLSVRCLDELGANAVYFDQVSCSPPQRCYDPAHGHPLGGGRWWADGYREMMGEVKRAFVKRDAVVVSEQMGEMWLDLIDVYLNATKYDKTDVPLFPAVYSGHCVHYGRPVPLELREDEAFREFARTLVWGEAFGWISPGVPQYRTYAARQKLIGEMARFRRDHAEFLVYGSLEDELRPLDPDPDVFGTVYRTVTDGRRRAFAVNASAEAKTVRFRFPGADTIQSRTVPPRQVAAVDENLGK